MLGESSGRAPTRSQALEARVCRRSRRDIFMSVRLMNSLGGRLGPREPKVFERADRKDGDLRIAQLEIVGRELADRCGIALFMDADDKTSRAEMAKIGA